jgi:Secretion system C-terminal sorting domain
LTKRNIYLSFVEKTFHKIEFKKHNKPYLQIKKKQTMKNSFKIFVTLFILAFAVNVMSQVPTYNLTSTNFSMPNTNQLVWNIVITHTNANTFEYAGGQYFYDFNTAALNGGTGALAILPGADFPVPFQPRNPTVSGSQLRLASNSLPGAGNGLILPQGTPMIVVKLMLSTNTTSFSTTDLNLLWRNGPTNPYTKINAYIGTMNTEVTDPNNHSINCDPLICTPLPVELASFTAGVTRNNVTLNWSTATETNNQGFDIERKLASATDWTRIGNVAGNGTTTEQKNYTYSDRANTGTYNYRLKQIDLNGNFTYHSLTSDVEVGVPSVYNLSQNYPNPFNPSTKVDYDLPYDGKVSIILYDISGREVANLVNDVKTAGYYTLQFNASNLASGLYFYRITAQGSNNNFVQTKKMVLVK